MSPKKEPRVTVAVRLSPDGLRAIDKRAEEDVRSRSEMIRWMLKYAALHMPRGWRP